ncbi:MAG: indole-3-glycerol-phosphate synthase [Actinomycetes bacterium]|jgi:indole-3-glycerol phosphate synthase
MSGLLGRMSRSSRERVAEAKGRVPDAEMARRAAEAPPPPPFQVGSFGLIAEVKYRSPSLGVLAPGGDPEDRVAAYCGGGAAAISVLTEPSEFGGSLEHLKAAARVAGRFGRPVMRKDFLVDPYQVYEARAAGAGGVLLIVRMLSDLQIDEMLEVVADLGMFALVEAFDAEDLERIAALAPAESVFIGVNCRDLSTLEVDPGRLLRLRPFVPDWAPAVAESGIEGPEDAAAVASAGYRLALVGTALMDSGDPRAAVADLVSAGREVVACS